MKQLFLILDCSGSIVSDDSVKVGQINDLLSDLIRACKEKNNIVDIKVICYADEAKWYWNSASNSGFYEISESEFGGRSNLGTAYKLIHSTIEIEVLERLDCILVLISDGEATDNYKKALAELDPDGKMTRVALSIGTTTMTTEIHALDESMHFIHGVRDREAFISKVVDCI